MGQSVVELELQKRQVIEAFKTATSDLMRRELEADAEKLDAQIRGGRTERTKLEVQESDIDSFLKEAKKVMEHPAELLLNPVNTPQLVSLYSLVFDATPTYPEIANGTPKLSWVFLLSDASQSDEFRLAGLQSLEWNTIEETIKSWIVFFSN